MVQPAAEKILAGTNRTWSVAAKQTTPGPTCFSENSTLAVPSSEGNMRTAIKTTHAM